jgi:5-formyltetrahydrofolate cyclo-ligase
MATMALELDPRTVAAAGAQLKHHLRQRMQALRKAMPSGALEERTERVILRLSALPEFACAHRVALYRAITRRHELDLEPIDALLRARGSAVYYPFMLPSGEAFLTGFQRVLSLEQLVERGRGFAEPPATGTAAARGELDLVVVPALAVCPSGHRLGYGAGWYDATLPDVCPPAISVAVAYDFQLVAELPVTPRDVPCDVVVTETRTIRPARAGS